MTGLLDSRGNPLAFASPKKKTADIVTEPIVGGTFGQWAGRDSMYITLPGGGVMQFDLSRLTLADYRSMRYHYQIGASLNVLSFLMHQMDWWIECENAEIQQVLEEDLREHWTQFIRGMSQAFWAGFSPMAVNFKNARDGYVRIKEFRDLVPEETRVRWKKIEGWAPAGKPKPADFIYDGFYHNNSLVPPGNSMWYPILMENGDHYGRKLLKPAFPSWFFSNLLHLFANRYFERYGEPLPVGRAPFDDDVHMGNGVYVPAKKAMEDVVRNLRNRSTVILPNDKDQNGNYEYALEYLESQMRGADFERYMSRLDEEMSLSVFTPVLLFRTSDVGSYNLGEAHYRIFQQMLNAITGDLQIYIQKYLIDRMRVINFGQDSPRARWVFRKQGQGDIDKYKLLMSELIRLGVAMPDLDELGAIVGLKWNEVKQLTQDPEAVGDDITIEPVVEGDTKATGAKTLSAAARGVLSDAATRVARAAAKGGDVPPSLGYARRLAETLSRDGHGDLDGMIGEVFAGVNRWIAQASTVVDATELGDMTNRLLVAEVESRLAA